MYYYKEVKKPNRLVGMTLLAICGKYLQHKVDVRVEENDTRQLKAPYLILGNHVSYWDPFLVNMFIDEPMCYIAEAVYFRNPILRFFLNIAGSIPKKRFVTQYSPIKRLIRAKENGRVLGIFPEGERRWDGTTEGINLFSTAKLIKILAISVVVVKIQGGYLAYPRWAKASRKGRINLSYKLCLTGQETRELSLDQIEKSLRVQLHHDEVAYQKIYQNKYTGKRLAEHLEHLLFACPRCQSLNTLISSGNGLNCHQCNYSVVYNQYGFLEGSNKKLYFDNVRDWNYWQNRYLKNFVREKLKKHPDQMILKDEDINILEGSFHHPFRSVGQGILCLNKDGLFFEFTDSKKLPFNLRDIIGLNVQFQSILEFMYKDKLYRFQFHNPHISAYKWVQAIHYVQEGLSVVCQ